VYLPRFPAGAVVQRIGPTPVEARNPMPDIVEKQDHLGAVAQRGPRWIVVSTGYAWRFLREAKGEAAGHMLPESQRMSLADADATNHMRALFAGAAGYDIAHVAHYTGHPPVLPPHPLHASLACDVWIFQRR
jgi:predicted cobalt transporter CbtA